MNKEPKPIAIQSLIDFLRLTPLTIEPEPLTPSLSKHSIRYIRITSQQQKLSLAIFDEFQDLELDNPVIWLHLLLETCEYYEEAKDYQQWRTDIGFHDNLLTKQLYSELQQKVHIIRQLVGFNIKAISDYDVQFNTSLCQQLRALRSQDLKT